MYRKFCCSGLQSVFCLRVCSLEYLYFKSTLHLHHAGMNYIYKFKKKTYTWSRVRLITVRFLPKLQPLKRCS